MDRKQKIITYSLVGVGASLLTYILIRKLKGKEGDTSVTARKGEVEVSSIDYSSLSNPRKKVPAVGMLYNKESNDFDIFEINYTPRRASTPHNELKNNDLYYLSDPNKIPTEFTKLSKPDQMIHPNDYKILQLKGLIPMDFPLARVAYVKSANGKNEFVVGYSKEENITLKGGSTFKGVHPLWVVSFGQDFNTDSKAPKDFGNEAEFKETAQRILLAEYLLSRSNEGCARGLGHNMCAAEKNAILGILLERYKVRKDKKKPKSLTYEQVVMKPQSWNDGGVFQSSYRGYPVGDPNYGKTTKKPIAQFDSRWNKNFNDHYDSDFWHMPSLSLNATHFIHHKALRSAPRFISTEGEPLSSQNEYAAKKPIKVGQLTAIDRRKTFR